MTLLWLDIPLDETSLQNWSATLRGWLETQLAGTRLLDTVQQLEELHGPPPQTTTLPAVLGASTTRLQTEGLAALSQSQLRQLLTQPRLLLDLQELVLVADTPYWNTLVAQDELTNPVATVPEQRVAELVRTSAARVPAAATTPGSSPVAGSRPFWSRGTWRWLVPVATAAVLLVVLWARAPTGEWGWQRPGVLTADLPAPEYLRQLERTAGEFDLVPLDTPQQLEQRLTGIRSACDALIAARPSRLTVDERAWLVEKCQKWSGRFDGHLADLRTGEKSFETIRTEVNDTLSALLSALRSKADAIESRA